MHIFIFFNLNNILNHRVKGSYNDNSKTVNITKDSGNVTVIKDNTVNVASNNTTNVGSNNPVITTIENYLLSDNVVVVTPAV